MSDFNLPSLSTVLDNIDIGISIFDNEGRFLFVNRAVLNISGRSRKDFLGRTVYDFQREGILDVPVVPAVYETKKPIARIQESITKQGEKKKFLVRASPIFDNDGNVVYALADRIEIDRINEDYKIAMRHKVQLVNHKNWHDKEEQIISQSNAMIAILRNADRVAAFDSSVLLQGESGTGKEIIAQYIHRKSRRSAKEMIAINCGSMPEALLESELFGYEKGAFTGALSSGKMGLLEAADQGILFLDEVNSMPLNLQTKLLRVLETKSIVRIGSTSSKTVDFRIIAASNVDLNHCVKKGAFREDLYYRLNVIPIVIPPLRERKKDIIPLTDYFLQIFCEKYGLEKQLSKRIYKEFEEYSWPGNVRELRNFIERVVVMSDASALKINEIPFDALISRDSSIRPEVTTSDDKDRLIKALALHKGHRQNTADYLGISRRTLQYKLKKYEII